MTVYTRMHDKITYRCSVHGLVQSSATEHLSGCDCPLCSREANLALTREAGNKEIAERKLGWDEVIKRAKEVHGDRYDYSLLPDIEYNSVYQVIPVICLEHGIFHISIAAHIYRKCGCPKEPSIVSKGENEIHNLLKSYKLHCAKKILKVADTKIH